MKVEDDLADDALIDETVPQRFPSASASVASPAPVPSPVPEPGPQDSDAEEKEVEVSGWKRGNLHQRRHFLHPIKTEDDEDAALSSTSAAAAAQFEVMLARCSRSEQEETEERPRVAEVEVEAEVEAEVEEQERPEEEKDGAEGIEEEEDEPLPLVQHPMIALTTVALPPSSKQVDEACGKRKKKRYRLKKTGPKVNSDDMNLHTPPACSINPAESHLVLHAADGEGEQVQHSPVPPLEEETSQEVPQHHSPDTSPPHPHGSNIAQSDSSPYRISSSDVPPPSSPQLQAAPSPASPNVASPCASQEYAVPIAAPPSAPPTAPPTTASPTTPSTLHNLDSPHASQSSLVSSLNQQSAVSHIPLDPQTLPISEAPPTSTVSVEQYMAPTIALDSMVLSVSNVSSASLVDVNAAYASLERAAADGGRTDWWGEGSGADWAWSQQMQQPPPQSCLEPSMEETTECVGDLEDLSPEQIADFLETLRAPEEQLHVHSLRLVLDAGSGEDPRAETALAVRSLEDAQTGQTDQDVPEATVVLDADLLHHLQYFTAADVSRFLIDTVKSRILQAGFCPTLSARQPDYDPHSEEFPWHEMEDPCSPLMMSSGHDSPFTEYRGGQESEQSRSESLETEKTPTELMRELMQLLKSSEKTAELGDRMSELQAVLERAQEEETGGPKEAPAQTLARVSEEWRSAEASCRSFCEQWVEAGEAFERERLAEETRCHYVVPPPVPSWSNAFANCPPLQTERREVARKRGRGRPRGSRNKPRPDGFRGLKVPFMRSLHASGNGPALYQSRGPGKGSGKRGRPKGSLNRKTVQRLLMNVNEPLPNPPQPPLSSTTIVSASPAHFRPPSPTLIHPALAPGPLSFGDDNLPSFHHAFAFSPPPHSLHHERLTSDESEGEADETPMLSSSQLRVFPYHPDTMPFDQTFSSTAEEAPIAAEESTAPFSSNWIPAESTPAAPFPVEPMESSPTESISGESNPAKSVRTESDAGEFQLQSIIEQEEEVGLGAELEVCTAETSPVPAPSIPIPPSSPAPSTTATSPAPSSASAQSPSPSPAPVPSPLPLPPPIPAPVPAPIPAAPERPPRKLSVQNRLAVLKQQMKKKNLKL